MNLLDLVLPIHFTACAFLAVFGLHRVWLLVDYLRTRRESEPPPTMSLAGPLPRVTVQLPVFNERTVCERLVDAVCALDYPRDRLEVQVLDDSTDETSDLIAARVARWRDVGVDIVHVRRHDRSGFKAGALGHGLARAKGELIAIFDADFVPRPGFLRDTVPAFTDPGVGMVQARWGHLNRNASWLTEAQSVFLDAHFTIEHGVRSARRRFFNFNGTAGVWRRSAIEAAGGWDATTLTEDLDLSFRAQLAGSRFAYLDHVEVPAELPDDVNAFKGQQHRWAKGSIQTARRLLPTILRAPLPLRVRLDATLKLLQNCAFLFLAVVVLTMPAVAFGRAHQQSVTTGVLDLVTLMFATLPVVAHFVIAERARGIPLRRVLLFVPFALGLGAALALSNARAVLEGFFELGEKSFVRTPKRGEGGRKRYATPLRVSSLLELALGVTHLFTAVWLAANGQGLLTPFLWTFGLALTALGGASAAEGLRGLLSSSSHLARA